MQRPDQNISKSEHSTLNRRNSKAPIPESTNAQSTHVRRIDDATTANIYSASVDETIWK
jgi:hypothetical protein